LIINKFNVSNSIYWAHPKCKYCTTVSDVFEKFKSKYDIVLYCEFLETKFKF